MQTTITAEMPFGIPGTHANGQPFRADAYGASDKVTFGYPAYRDANGKVKNAVNSTASLTYVGMFVGPEQHVRWVLPDAAPSITLDPAVLGFEVAVASRGCWVCAVGSTTTKTDGTEGSPVYETWAVGDKLKLGFAHVTATTSPASSTPDGAMIFKKSTSSSDTIVATVVKVDADGKFAIIRLGE